MHGVSIETRAGRGPARPRGRIGAISSRTIGMFPASSGLYTKIIHITVSSLYSVFFTSSLETSAQRFNSTDIAKDERTNPEEYPRFSWSSAERPTMGSGKGRTFSGIPPSHDFLFFLWNKTDTIHSPWAAAFVS